MVSDGRGGTLQQTITIVVTGSTGGSAGNRIPEWRADPVSIELSGQLFNNRNILASATDADRDPLTYTVLSSPDFITVEGDGPIFSVRLSGLGEGTIVVQVDDGKGGVLTHEWPVSVTTPATGPPVTLGPQDTIRVDPGDLTPITIGLGDLFIDPDGDVLTYRTFGAVHDVVTVELSDTDLTLTPVGVGRSLVFVEATDPSGTTRNRLVVDVGTAPAPPVAGSLDRIEAFVGVPLPLDFSSEISGESLTYSVFAVDREIPPIGEARFTSDGSYIFNGQFPGQAEFRVVARDPFQQQVVTTVTVVVSSSTEVVGPFSFDLDPTPGYQGLLIQEDASPGDTVVVEGLVNETISRFLGSVAYDPEQVEPLLETFSFVAGTSTNSPLSGPSSQNGLSVLNVNANDLETSDQPAHLFSVSFLVKPEFDTSTRIRLSPQGLDLTDTWQQIHALDVEIRPVRTRLPADFDDSGDVGFSDFLLFAGAFGKTAPTGSSDALFDLDGDGEIGFTDFLVFAGVFGTTE